MVKRDELVRYLDRKLNLAGFAGDVSNNGLQIEGADEVRKVVVGVDGSLSLFERAAEAGAQMVIVHHGISWGSEPRRFTGLTAARLKFMFGHGISLYAAHLPLDAHPELGNNAELCRIAGLADLTPCCNYHGLDIGFAGKFAVPTTLRELAARFGFEGTFYGDPDRKLTTATAVSGGGGLDALCDAVDRGADVLITGEFSHEMYHAVKESGLAVLPLGHYASETYGVRAVLKDLLKTFPLEGEFIDLPTGL